VNKAINNLKKLFISCAAAFLAAGGALVSSEASSLPDSIHVTGTRDVQIASKPYIQLVSPDDQVADASVSVNSSYSVTAMLHGLLPIKTIEVTRIKPEYVELSGQPVGIMLYSDGLVVAGLSPVETENGSVNPGKLCGLQPGDIIKKINGIRPESTQQMLDAVESSGGKAIDLTVIRTDKTVETLKLQPVFSSSDSLWRAGIWIKETSSGLGMLTFVTIDSDTFGGLGHAICDADTGTQIQIYGGDLINAELTGVIPGSKGLPGELIGNLGREKLGTVDVNCELGVFGHYAADSRNMKLTRVAMKQELKEGRAQILTTLPGDTQPQMYDAIIEQINYDPSAPTRNMIIRVDDQRVLDRTGGIVQGMSGSPIIQNGELVGAVTHVLVNDPTKGYAIFAENMLDAAG